MRHFFGSHKQPTFHNNMHIRCCDLYSPTETVVNENSHDHVTFRETGVINFKITLYLCACINTRYVLVSKQLGNVFGIFFENIFYPKFKKLCIIYIYIIYNVIF